MVFVGEEAILSGEAHSLSVLNLQGAQSELIAEAAKSGKPVVVVVMAGRPLTIERDLANCDAMLYSFHPGTMGGEALADIIEGKISPSGKTPITFLRDAGQAPFYYNHNNSGRPCNGTETLLEDIPMQAGQTSLGCTSYYLDTGYGPLFPFGYGLSYTAFEQTEFDVKENKSGYDVSLKIRNTGGYAGKDVMQVYIQRPYTDYDRQHGIEKPAVELVGFAKTDKLDAQTGEQTLTVSIDRENLRTYDAYGQKTYILEAGDYYLAVGTDAHDALNNILAKKGADATKMDAAGKAGFVHTVTVKNKGDDFKKYSVSESTGNAITNRFDEADIKLAECTGDQKITYLSRSDWEGTYPKDLYKLALTDTVAKQISYVGGGEVEDDFMVDMPTLNKVTVDPEYLELLNEGKSEDEKQDRLWAINMRELAYDDPLWNNLLDQLTFNEMCNLITMGGMSTVALDSVNLPGTVTRDGPAGLGRFFADKFGVTRQGVCYPRRA